MIEKKIFFDTNIPHNTNMVDQKMMLKGRPTSSINFEKIRCVPSFDERATWRGI